jgi:hypothetical protein
MSMEAHDDFAFEPIPGLPEELPEGERILWQGSPRAQGLARHALHTRKVFSYCLILIVWVAATAFYEGGTATGALASLAWPIALSAALLAILHGLAVWMARSTIYTITDRRVVMRFGIVLPMSINLPFVRIETAALRRHGDGSGDIPLALKGEDRFAWLHLWPHARPWRIGKSEPMLRDLDDVEDVAALLAHAMADALPEGRATLPRIHEPQVAAAARRGLATA